MDLCGCLCRLAIGGLSPTAFNRPSFVAVPGRQRTAHRLEWGAESARANVVPKATPSLTLCPAPDGPGALSCEDETSRMHCRLSAVVRSAVATERSALKAESSEGSCGERHEVRTPGFGLLRAEGGGHKDNQRSLLQCQYRTVMNPSPRPDTGATPHLHSTSLRAAPTAFRWMRTAHSRTKRGIRKGGPTDLSRYSHPVGTLF